MYPARPAFFPNATKGLSDDRKDLINEHFQTVEVLFTTIQRLEVEKINALSLEILNLLLRFPKEAQKHFRTEAGCSLDTNQIMALSVTELKKRLSDSSNI